MNSLDCTITFLLVLLTIHTSSGQDVSCEDCMTIVDGFKNFTIYGESIIFEQGVILTQVCPGAGLGDEDDHPNCEKFTAHHWKDLAEALFPIFIHPDYVCTRDLGVCPSSGLREVDCDACKMVTEQIGTFLVQEENMVEMVSFLESDFCENGVPTGDIEFCKDYAKIVLPQTLEFLSTVAKALTCSMSFGVC